MNTASSIPLIPGEHRVRVAVRTSYPALLCEKILSGEGYPVTVFPAEITASQIIETLRADPPHLLIVEDLIPWEEEVPLFLRLRADTALATIPMILMLHNNAPPEWAGWEGVSYDRTAYMTWPFSPAELKSFTGRILEEVVKGNGPPFPETHLPTTRSEEKWQAWRQQLPPFALFEAAWAGDQERIERLIALGADVRARNTRGSTALHYAARRGNIPLIEFLLQQGAEIDAQDADGATLLHYAVSKSDLPLLKFLLRQKIALDVKEDQGETPLWRAAARADVLAMNLLLKRGADPHLANNNGETALMQLRGERGETAARRKQQARAFTLLLQYAADPNTNSVQAAKSRMTTTRPDIVRLETEERSGLYHGYLLGLNIFQYNDVACPIAQSPDAIFLFELTARLFCATHVSSLVMQEIADTPEEVFGSPEGPIPYLRARIGYHNIFYDLNDWPTWEACIFPHVTPLFWQALLREEGYLSALIDDHGLAFYVAPHSDTSEELQRLLAAPFPGEPQLLTALCDLYALVVLIGHDGQFFEVYTRHKENLRLLEPALQIAVASIEASTWFQEHQAELTWDELWCCLRKSEQENEESR